MRCVKREERKATAMDASLSKRHRRARLELSATSQPRNEKAVGRRKPMRENRLKELLHVAEPGCEVCMECCGGAHHRARRLQTRGFEARMIAPQFVKPYVKSNQNDANDAEAICEAMSRPHMRFAAVKMVEQQDPQAVHRIRAELIKQRTAKSNQIRNWIVNTSISTTTAKQAERW